VAQYKTSETTARFHHSFTKSPCYALIASINNLLTINKLYTSVLSLQSVIFMDIMNFTYIFAVQIGHLTKS